MPDIMLRLGQEVLVAEGAMGTMLQRYGMPPGSCPDQLNEIDPETVEQVHRLYHLAGANCAITNTFGATRAKLSSFDIEMRADIINRDGVKLARLCKPEHILGDIGPCGRVLAPAGDATYEELFEQYREQAASLASANPDALLIETMIDIADARCAVLAARAACDLPVFVTCSFNANGVLPLSGTDPATAAVILEACGAAAVGINCSLGPEEVYPLFVKMAEATSLPLIVQPNAGMPQTNRRGEVVYSATADDFAHWAVRFADAGAAIIGSCCGSTPAFTGAIAAMVAGRRVRAHGVSDNAPSQLAGTRKRVFIGEGAELARIVHVAARFTGDAQEDEEVAAEVVADALDEYADDAALVSVDVEGGADAQVLELLSDLATTSGSSLCFGAQRPELLEAALRQTPVRMLVDTSLLDASCGGVDEALRIAGRYGAMALVRLRSSGPECDTDQAIAFIDAACSTAREQGMDPRDLMIDVSSGRVGSASQETMLEALAHARACGCRTMYDVTADAPSINAAKRLAFFSTALAEGIDAAAYAAGDEAASDLL